MKVKELIEHLGSLDQDREVRLEDEDGHTFEATIVFDCKDFKNGERFVVVK